MFCLMLTRHGKVKFPRRAQTLNVIRCRCRRHSGDITPLKLQQRRPQIGNNALHYLPNWVVTAT